MLVDKKTEKIISEIFNLFDQLETDQKHLVYKRIQKEIRKTEHPKLEVQEKSPRADKRLQSTYSTLGKFFKKN